MGIHELLDTLDSHSWGDLVKCSLFFGKLNPLAFLVKKVAKACLQWQDTKRNGQPLISQLDEKSTCQNINIK
jgi:hypothetical protein